MKWNCHFWWVSLLFLSASPAVHLEHDYRKGKIKQTTWTRIMRHGMRHKRCTNDKDAGWRNMCTSAASPWRFSLDAHWVMSFTNFYFYSARPTEYFRSALIATHATIFSSCLCVTLEWSFHRVQCVGGVHQWCWNGTGQLGMLKLIWIEPIGSVEKKTIKTDKQQLFY